MSSGNGAPNESFDLTAPGAPVHVRAPITHPAWPAGPSVVSILARRWPTAVIVGLLLAAANVLGIWYLVKPQYKVFARLHVSPVVKPILVSDPGSSTYADYRQFMGTQALTIVGPAMVGATLARPEVRSLETLKAHANPVGYVQKSIEAGQVPSSQLLEVSMVGEAPKDLTAIVNALVATYLQDVEDKEREWDRKVLSSLRNEQSELERKLEIKNRQLQDAAVTQGMGGAQDSGALIDRWLSEAHQLLTQAKKERALAQAKLEALGEADPGETDPAAFEEFVNRDAEMLGLKEQLRLLKAAAASDASQGRGPGHPDVIARPRLIVDLEERLAHREQILIQAFGVSQKRELESQFRHADITTKVLESELSKLQNERASVAGSQFLLSDLRREREYLEHSLGKVQEKIWTVEVEQKRESRVRIDSWAQVPPAPNFDKRPKIYAVAVMMSLACGVGVAFLRGRLDHSIHNPVEIVGQLGVQVLGSVEHIPANGTVLAGLDPRLIEPIRSISTTLLAASPQRSAHSRLITSPTPGSGKSSMAVNLARSLAATGRQVLLVDGDNHGQGTTRRLNLAGHKGLADYLEGADPGGLVHSLSVNLDVVPSGNRSETFGDVLRAKGAADRFRQLFAGYEEIIIDSPPLLVKSDAIALATMVDEVVLVLRAGKTTHQEAHLARQYLESVRGNFVGVILNAVDPKEARYGYGYSYAYGNGQV